MTIAWPTTGDDVAKSLNWPDSRGAELEDYAIVAVSRIEQMVGPWRGQALTYTLTLLDGAASITLPWPIGDMPTATRDGDPVTIQAVDLDAGIIYGDLTAGTYTIAATARASTTCPAEVKLAARKLASHLARQEKIGPAAPAFAGSDASDTDVLQGFALPRAVSELIAPHVRLGGFA